MYGKNEPLKRLAPSVFKNNERFTRYMHCASWQTSKEIYQTSK